MSQTPDRLLDRFSGLDVIVVGEAILDRYLEGSADRICREAPVPIVDVTRRTDAPGGAANTAVNVRALGARATLLSAVGADVDGSTLRATLGDRGVATEHLISSPRRRTLAKHRLVGAGRLLLRFDQGSTDPIDGRAEDTLIAALSDHFPRADAVVVSDYGYGIVTPRVRRALADLQARTPRVLVADAKQLGAYRDVGLTAVKPNFREAVELLGGSLDDGSGRAEAIAALGDRLLDVTGARLAAVTLDTDGALMIERHKPTYRTYARPTCHGRAAGAGDTFLSALALALAAGADPTEAADLASAGAAVVVGKPGTATCSAAELKAALATAHR